MKPICEVSPWGTKRWYLNGKRHREDGPAVEWVGGDKYWYLNDQLHREDGPAVEWLDGDREWYLNDQRHREDGPAIEYANGDKSWWLLGTYMEPFTPAQVPLLLLGLTDL